MKPAEIIWVEDTVTTVSCDGGKGPYGHPRVFLTLNEADQVECPYCSRSFKKKMNNNLKGQHG